MSSVCFVTYVPGPDPIFLLTAFRSDFQENLNRRWEHALERPAALYTFANDVCWASKMSRARIVEQKRRQEGKKVRVIDEA